ncbi:MAG: DUF3575 domain-containing protein [Flavobacteriaceae bacterium]|jgi:hypothetical protein
MKRIVLILVILVSFTSVRAQEFDQNELRLNLLDMLSRGTLNASYERFLTPQTSLGVTTMVALNNDYTEKFEFAPSFRMYFNDDLLVLRKSVFVEVFTAFVVADSGYYDYSYVECDYPTQSIQASTEPQGLSIAPCGYYGDPSSEAAFALGMMLGKKWVNQSNFTFEFGLGFGRYLTQTYNEAYPRINLSIGKRF